MVTKALIREFHVKRSRLRPQATLNKERNKSLWHTGPQASWRSSPWLSSINLELHIKSKLSVSATKITPKFFRGALQLKQKNIAVQGALSAKVRRMDQQLVNRGCLLRFKNPSHIKIAHEA